MHFDFRQYVFNCNYNHYIQVILYLYAGQFSVDKQFPQLSETIFAALLLSTIIFRGLSSVSPSVCVIL